MSYPKRLLIYPLKLGIKMAIGEITTSPMPYALLDGEHVVSNVSVNIIDIAQENKKRRYIQLGTIMTDKTYRGKGLSRLLIEKVLEEWKDKCDAIYLFANDTVLDFYPQFGFEKANEYQHHTTLFVLSNKENIFIDNQLMFPLLSHA